MTEPVVDDDQAVVAVAAYSVNRGETFLLAAPPAAWRPGKDVAGTVVAAAADGSGPGVGVRVVAHVGHSGWAERVAVPTVALVTLPDGSSTATESGTIWLSSRPRPAPRSPP